MFRRFAALSNRHALWTCIVTFILGLACIVMGAKRQAAPAEPAIVITPLVADLGTINQGERKDVVFTIKNNSGHILTVVPTTLSSCSCVRMVGGPADLFPGEEHAFHALVDTSLYPGSFQREAAFILRGLGEKDFWASANIVAEVAPECAFVPSKLRLDHNHSTARTKIVPGFRSGISILHAYCTAPAVTCLVLDDGASVEVAWESSQADAKLPNNSHVVIKTTSTIDDLQRIPILSDSHESRR